VSRSVDDENCRHAGFFGSRPQVEVSASVLDMSMSLDGFIADPNDFLGGDDGERLHKWGRRGWGGPAGRPGRPGNSGTNGTRQVRASRDGGLPSSWITGAVMTHLRFRVRDYRPGK
jgi:hypothetical protein